MACGSDSLGPGTNDNEKSINDGNLRLSTSTFTDRYGLHVKIVLENISQDIILPDYQETVLIKSVVSSSLFGDSLTYSVYDSEWDRVFQVDNVITPGEKVIGYYSIDLPSKYKQGTGHITVSFGYKTSSYESIIELINDW